ncbi:VOC family protein [Agromyces sp. NPDC049794]|uniref:VOC family protein n=1 Tax=unclassified Agromyces TaxID=2639701 RepID=UPI0033E6768A
MANLVPHFEMYGSEPERLIDFYSALFDWKFTRVGDMDYWLIDTGEGSIGEEPGYGINGGLSPREGPSPEPGAPVNGCNIVVAVEEVDDLFAKAIDIGATESVAPNDMPGVGRVAYLFDPDRNLFGVLSETLSDGTNVMETPGALGA